MLSTLPAAQDSQSLLVALRAYAPLCREDCQAWRLRVRCVRGFVNECVCMHVHVNACVSLSIPLFANVRLCKHKQMQAQVVCTSLY